MNKIETLTPDQEILMDKVAQEYEDIIFSGDDSYKEDEIIKGIDFLYGLAELEAPKIVICSSPMDMKKQAGLKKGETFDYFGQGYDVGWTSFYDFMEQIGVDYDKDFDFTKWKNFIKNSGVFATCLTENVAFVCIRPFKIFRNTQLNLHNDKAMAIEWRDGYGEYVLNGVFVDKELVLTPTEKLDPTMLLKEKNAEIRREIVRKIGLERIVSKLGAETLDKQGDYELLLLDLKDGRKREYLKMKNPSIGVFHIEGVPPGTKTVKEALFFRNGLTSSPVRLS